MKAHNRIFAVLIILVLSACFSPFQGSDASLTIDLGRNNRAAYPPDEETFSRLVHTIELSGPSGTQTHILSEGKSSITIKLASGSWVINVRASLDGNPYAEGSANAEVTGGEQVSVALTMMKIAADYTVTFNSNGGSAVESQTVKEGEKVTRPANPTLDGRGFVDWYSDAELTEVYRFDSEVTANITLYAKWSTVMYTVSFESNDGSGISSQTVGAGGKAVRPEAPTRAGYEFAGWYKDADLNEVYGFDSEVTANITLYAKWLPLYTVTFNSNGGSAVESQTVKEGEKVTRPANPTLDGRGFVDWYSDAALTEVYRFDSEVTANITLYAKWNAETYTISFESNGGSGISSQTVGAGGKAVRPEAPTRAGYEFAGWYRDASFISIWDFENDLVTADIMFYAKWNQVFSLPLIDVSLAAPYLTAQTQSGGTVDNPVKLPMRIDLGTMTDAASNWQRLLTAIETAGKFVNLDLTVCTMSGTEFNPDNKVVNGKGKIVNLALPDTAASIADGTDKLNSTFKSFSTLKSFSGMGLTSIGDYAFYNCTNLTLISLSANLKSIGDWAFQHCTTLALVTCNAATPPTLGTGVFNDTSANLQIKVPAASVGAYQTAENWKAYANKIVSIDGTYQGTFTITYEQITDAAPNITGPTLSLSGTVYPRTQELTFDASAFDEGSITWAGDTNGDEYEITGMSFTLSVDPVPDPDNSGNYRQYDTAGTYVLTLIVVTKDGVPYNKTFTFKVVE